MLCNVGGTERYARIILGIVLLLIGLLLPLAAVWKVVVLVVGAVALLTGIVRFCPGSYVLGINTCKPKTG